MINSKSVVTLILIFCSLTVAESLSAQEAAQHTMHVEIQEKSIHIERLEQSTRHHEWIDIPVTDLAEDLAYVPEEGRSVKSFVVYPERSDNAPVVITIHENRGLTDWVRSFADQLAAEGYLVIAPDLLSDFSANFDETADFANQDDARTALYALNQEQITLDLLAVQEYASALGGGDGTVSMAGFCWGGAQTFRFATNTTGLTGAYVFYGSSPSEASEYARISVPVYGFYAENDQRINSQLPATMDFANAAGLIFEMEMYPGSGHAFMRLGEESGASEANVAARDAAWKRLLYLLGNS